MATNLTQKYEKYTERDLVEMQVEYLSRVDTELKHVKKKTTFICNAIIASWVAGFLLFIILLSVL